MVEKNKKLGKNSNPIYFSLQMKVKFFFHSIFLIFQNDHLIEQTYFLNDSEVFNIKGYAGMVNQSTSNLANLTLIPIVSDIFWPNFKFKFVTIRKYEKIYSIQKNCCSYFYANPGSMRNYC
jgi:hypothetical protein